MEGRSGPALQQRKPRSHVVLALYALVALASCGEGSGPVDSAPVQQTPPQAPAPPPAATPSPAAPQPTDDLGSTSPPAAGPAAPPPPSPAPPPAPPPATPAPAAAPTPATSNTSSSSATPRLATASLSWTASASDAVAGYRVYYGVAAGSYQQARGAGIDVGRVTAYELTGLAPGRRYFFAVTAYAADGSESSYSAEASKIVE